MSTHRLPVRPNLDQLKRQARELLRDLHGGDGGALALLREHHPDPIDPAAAKLADAQLVVARMHQSPGWGRLVQAVRLATAIWEDDSATVRTLVTANPRLLHEEVLIRQDSNWGPPLTYAANLGRDEIIRMLHALGATDLERAAGRAALQGKVETVRMLHEMAGRPGFEGDALGGPAYTLSVEGTAVLLALGAPVVDASGRRLAPVDVVLQTDGRNPDAKHAILEMYVRHGLELPDTPVMALHRGRLDLLEAHLDRHPDLLTGTFTHRETTRRRWAAAIRSTPQSARRSAGRRSCTCAWSTGSWKSRDGCSTAAWTRTSAPRPAPAASAATRRSSTPSSRSRTSG
ncbi:MAG TPA: hypothetical protein VF198_06535 [Vicinamibacterales bacterium]